MLLIRGLLRVALVIKNLPANAEDIRDVGLIPGLGRSPGEGHGNPLHYSFFFFFIVVDFVIH